MHICEHVEVAVMCLLLSLSILLTPYTQTGSSGVLELVDLSSLHSQLALGILSLLGFWPVFTRDSEF